MYYAVDVYMCYVLCVCYLCYAAACLQVFRLLKAHLAPSGVALVASKKYYFGVGGGTLELQSLVEASTSTSSEEGGQLQCSVVFTAADGKSNVREIIEVRRRA